MSQSATKQEFVVAAATPNPLEIKWDDGARISITPIVPAMDYFEERGEGFRPNEKISTISFSNDEKITYEIAVDEKGKFVSFLLPATIGHDSGRCERVYKRQNTGEERTLKYSYGKQVLYEALKNKLGQ